MRISSLYSTTSTSNSTTSRFPYDFAPQPTQQNRILHNSQIDFENQKIKAERETRMNFIVFVGIGGEQWMSMWSGKTEFELRVKVSQPKQQYGYSGTEKEPEMEIIEDLKFNSLSASQVIRKVLDYIKD